MPTVETIAALLLAHKWIPLAAAVIWLLVRLLKSDTKIPVNIPPRWRPVLAMGLGAVAGVLDNVAGGTPWKDALVNGLTAGVLAILANVFGVDVLRAGSDVPLPKAISVRPPPPPTDAGGSIDVQIPKVPYLPPRNERRTLAQLAALAVFAVVLSGCGFFRAVEPVLNEIVVIVQDAQEVLAIAESSANTFFQLHPELKDAAATFAKDDARCHQGLDIILRLVAGGKDVNAGDLEAAFADFRAAYTDLSNLVAGFKSQAPGVAAEKPLPVPIAMTYRVH